MVEKISSLTNAKFSGIYTHYGASYQCRGADEIKNVASVAWGKLIDLAKRLLRMVCCICLKTRTSWSNNMKTFHFLGSEQRE